MGYLVLARKYRPQTFAELVGQEHVARTLSNAIAQQRIPQAILLTGIRGVGKTSIARIFARALNCKLGPTVNPCPPGGGGEICGACAEMLAGRAIDVIEIDGASNNGVDQVRDLRENVKYLPQSGRYKVYIVDEVHMLTQAAFNALLKTLEEPPAHVVFVFATTEVHRIPATILSRCQRFDLRKIRTDILVERLREICRAEALAADDDALLVIAREGAGSLRDAVSLLDQVISYGGAARITAREVVDLLGVLDRRALLDLARAIAARDCDKAIVGLRALFDHGYEVRPILEAWLVMARNLAIASWSKSRELLPDLSIDEAAEISELAAALSPGLAERWYAMSERSFGDIVHASDPAVSLEVLLLKLLRAEALRSVDDLLVELKSIEARLGTPAGTANSARSSSTPPKAVASYATEAPARWGNTVEGGLPELREINAATARPQPTPAAGAVRRTSPAPPRPAAANPMNSSSAPVDFAKWGAIVDSVRSTLPQIAAILDQAQVARCDAEAILVNFEKKLFLADKVDEATSQSVIAEAIRRAWGTDVPFSTGRVDRVAAGQTLAAQRGEARAAADAKARSDLLGNPVVSAVKSIFEAEVREVRAVKGSEIVGDARRSRETE
ncbi:MAG: DNA polymerase III subunit gamma/tau [Deltaproteobacteria bacterium]|nr:DNA polymerase III subunit gamma/tau [Deltaproteobacteria bacterium]